MPRSGVEAQSEASTTVVRIGYGIYYNQAAYNQLGTKLATQPPFASSNSSGIAAPLQRPDSCHRIHALPIPEGKTILNTYAVDRFYRAPYAQTLERVHSADPGELSLSKPPTTGRRARVSIFKVCPTALRPARRSPPSSGSKSATQLVSRLIPPMAIPSCTQAC